MNQLPRSPLHSSVFALALSSAAILLTLILRDSLQSNDSILFLVAVWASAWFHGRTGGLTATGASAVAFLYFILRPDPAAAAPSWSVIVRLVTFILMGALITWITASLRESRRLFSATLSSIGDAVVAADGEGLVTFLNPVAENLTGWPMAEARGKPSTQVLKLIDEKTREPRDNPIVVALRERAPVGVPDSTLLVSRSN